MKNSIDQPADTGTVSPQPCSEHTCATCFENRGCVFEHTAAILYSMNEQQAAISIPNHFINGHRA